MPHQTGKTLRIWHYGAMDVQITGKTSGREKPKTRRVALRCALAGMAAVCLWFLRVPLLRLAAWPLIACEPVAGAKYLWIPSSPLEAFDSPRCFDLVHDLYAEDMSRKVLIVRPAPERIVRLGAVPDFETVLRAELARRRIPREVVVVVPGLARSSWEECRCLTAWLHEHPADSVCLLCDRFASGNMRFVLGHSAGVDELARIRVVSVANPRYDAAAWWQNRSGAKAFVGAWLAQIYIHCHGEDVVQDDTWDPDEYERSIR
jgi:hypothetical protein